MSTFKKTIEKKDKGERGISDLVLGSIVLLYSLEEAAAMQNFTGRPKGQYFFTELNELLLYFSQDRIWFFFLVNHIFQKFIWQIVQPEDIAVWMIVSPAVGVLCFHLPVDIKLVVSRALEQLFVSGKVTKYS